MECSVKGHDYRVAKLSVFDQLKVTRKLLPVLAGMMSDFGAFAPFCLRMAKSTALSLMRLSRCLKPCCRVSLRNCLP